MVDSTEVVTSASLLYAPPVASQDPKVGCQRSSPILAKHRLSTSINCHFLKMVMTMMSFPHPITRPHTPITQQLCLRLYFYGIPLSLMRVHVKDRPKIGELLQIYDNLLLAHLM